MQVFKSLTMVIFVMSWGFYFLILIPINYAEMAVKY